MSTCTASLLLVAAAVGGADVDAESDPPPALRKCSSGVATCCKPEAQEGHGECSQHK